MKDAEEETQHTFFSLFFEIETLNPSFRVLFEDLQKS